MFYKRLGEIKTNEFPTVAENNAQITLRNVFVKIYCKHK